MYKSNKFKQILYKNFIAIVYILMCFQLIAKTNRLTLSELITRCYMSVNCDEYVRYRDELMKFLPTLPQLKNQSESLKNDKIVISFILPVHGEQSTIFLALQSIYKQHLEITFEVVLIDDASNDWRMEILNMFKKLYSCENGNLFVYRNLRYREFIDLINDAILHAHGKYICYVSSNNILAPQCVQDMLREIQKNDLDLAICGEVRYFDINGRWNEADIEKVRETVCCKRQLLDWANVCSACEKNIFKIICDASCVFTKKSWQSVGGFCNQVGHELAIFNLMCLKKGFKIGIDSNYCWCGRVVQ